MAADYHVTSTRTVSEEEARRRLARVYSPLINMAHTKRTADRDEFGDPNRSAVPHTATLGAMLAESSIC